VFVIGSSHTTYLKCLQNLLLNIAYHLRIQPSILYFTTLSLSISIFSTPTLLTPVATSCLLEEVLLLRLVELQTYEPER
jgi:hypothetical protein